VSEVLAALSFALDLTEGQPMGHTLRTCLIGMEIAERLDLPLADRRDLYYALMLKDVGCSSNSARVFELFGGDDRLAKQALKRVDWANYMKAAQYAMSQAAPDDPWFKRARRIASIAKMGPSVVTELVRTRCERGASIVARLGFGNRVAEAVRALDEHWDGRGEPRGLEGSAIPLLSRIMGVAQMLEVFNAIEGPAAALEMAGERRNRWFDPTVVDAAKDLNGKLASMRELDETGLSRAVADREPGGAALIAGPGTLDRIALGFAEVVDAKSPFTAAHSYRVTQLSLQIAERMGYSSEQRLDLRRAALLHDIGKLSVPNTILDKPAQLTPEEWHAVRLHPYYTEQILLHIRGFKAIAQVAGAHHERLDGRGYHRGLAGSDIPLDAQVIATADVYDALSSERPYRPAMPTERALEILESDRDAAIGSDCLDALRHVLGESDEAGHVAA
jgi:HD-GYP domain-containing protein (c-di-GMP phosphodiesterase class II)